MIERLLEYLPRGASEPVSVRVAISAPVATAEGYFESTLRIEGLNAPYEAPFEQVDSFGALMAAASMAQVILSSRIGEGDRLTWLGGEELGFPLLTPPKHHWTFRPSAGGEEQPISVTIAPPRKVSGRWACLVTLEADGLCEERWIDADAWASALERASSSVPSLLSDLVERLGGGSLADHPLAT